MSGTRPRSTVQHHGEQVPHLAIGLALTSPGYHWRDVRARTTNVGPALQDKLLCDLIEHFPRLPLTNVAAQADVLG